MLPVEVNPRHHNDKAGPRIRAAIDVLADTASAKEAQVRFNTRLMRPPEAGPPYNM